MTPEQRKRVAGRSYLLLMAIYIPVFLAFAASIMFGGNPSPIFELFFGCIFLIVGLHLLYFRNEMPLVLDDWNERPWVRAFMTVRYGSWFFTLMGVAFVLVGAGVVIGAL
jgi:hypothetical protein